MFVLLMVLVYLMFHVVGFITYIVLDGYIEGRYKKSILKGISDEAFVALCLLWPIIVPVKLFSIVILGPKLNTSYENIFEWAGNKLESAHKHMKKKGELSVDLDYQAEKYLLGKTDEK